MPKIKTHRASAKRFSFTGTGKIKKANAYKRHLLNSKTTKRTADLRKTGYVDKSNVATVKKLLPYG